MITSSTSNQVAAVLQRLPSARKSGQGYIAKCPAHEDHHPSLSISEGRDGCVLLKCHAGCAFEEIVIALGLQLKDLFRANTPRVLSLKSPYNKPSQSEVVPVIPRMPKSVSELWWKGVDAVQGQPKQIENIANYRGWPVPFVNYLAESLAISIPEQWAKRGIAWLVVVPEGERGDMRTRPVGYHVRIKGKTEKDKPWFYRPCKELDGQSIPALPFQLGDFDTARLLIIAEGEWDIVSFALAAGWLGDGCVLPQGVGLIGVRGVDTSDVFLRYYKPFWPRQADCLVIADNDKTGKKWYTGPNNFCSKLKPLCRKISVVHCAAEAKDFNDLYRRKLVGPEDITELLKSHGMGLGSEAEL
jgi:hypothetical protein